jgi:hypothetical protein
VNGWVEYDATGGMIATTAADGTYTLRHLEAGLNQVIVPRQPNCAPPPQSTVALVAGQTAAGVDFDFVTGRSLSGFGDAEGGPVKDAQVYAEDVQKPFLTDEKGKVTLTGLRLQGEVALFAAHPTQNLFAADIVDPDKGPWPGLLLRAPGQATGLLIDKRGGKPLAGVSVTCWPTRGDWGFMGEQFRAKLGLDSQDLKTDADGRWKLDKLIPGAGYRLVVFTETPGLEGRRPSDAGSFKAEGGPELQDVGIMECNMPEGQ